MWRASVCRCRVCDADTWLISHIYSRPQRLSVTPFVVPLHSFTPPNIFLLDQVWRKWKRTTRWHVSYQGYYTSSRMFVLFVWEIGEHTITRNTFHVMVALTIWTWMSNCDLWFLTFFFFFYLSTIHFLFFILILWCKLREWWTVNMISELLLKCLYFLPQGAVLVPTGGPRLPQDAVWGWLQSGGEGLPGERRPSKSNHHRLLTYAEAGIDLFITFFYLFPRLCLTMSVDLEPGTGGGASCRDTASPTGPTQTTRGAR